MHITVNCLNQNITRRRPANNAARNEHRTNKDRQKRRWKCLLMVVLDCCESICSKLYNDIYTAATLQIRTILLSNYLTKQYTVYQCMKEQNGGR